MTFDAAVYPMTGRIQVEFAEVCDNHELSLMDVTLFFVLLYRFKNGIDIPPWLKVKFSTSSSAFVWISR